MRTGFSLCRFSNREKPVFITGFPANENRIFPVWKYYTGKTLSWPCTGPVRDCSVRCFQLKLISVFGFKGLEFFLYSTSPVGWGVPATGNCYQVYLFGPCQSAQQHVRILNQGRLLVIDCLFFFWFSFLNPQIPMGLKHPQTWNMGKIFSLVPSKNLSPEKTEGPILYLVFVLGCVL